METKFTVKLTLKDPKHKDFFFRFFSPREGWQISTMDDTAPPDLLIYELGPDTDQEMQVIETLLNASGGGEIFLTADTPDAATVMKAMRIGVKEFVSQPFDNEEIEAALLRFRDRQRVPASAASRESGKVISILGGKGGVGATTVAVNLAVSLKAHSKKKKVALLDMNPLFGEIPLFLEIAPKFDWGKITANIDRLDNAFLDNVLTRHSSGVQILPSPAYLNGHQAPTPDIIQRLLDLMVTMFDYVIIDLGQSTNEAALKILQLSENVMLISTLSLPCLANTNRLKKSIVDLGYVSDERLNIVLNRYMKKSEISLDDVEKSIDKKLYWIIPNDYANTMTAINSGKPVAEIAPKSKIANNLEDMAGKVLGYRTKAIRKRTPMLSLFNIFQAKTS
jgi:pilus assembly protein CpaE